MILAIYDSRSVIQSRFKSPVSPPGIELAQRQTKLTEDLVEQRRADRPATMDWNRHSATVWMVPSFVTARVPSLQESELARNLLKLASGRARHS